MRTLRVRSDGTVTSQRQADAASSVPYLLRVESDFRALKYSYIFFYSYKRQALQQAYDGLQQ